MILQFIHRCYNIFIYRPYLKWKLNFCGKNFKFGYASELRNPQFFRIGDNFYSGPYGYFVTNKYIPVEIGNHIMFGPFCKIFGGDHDLEYTDNHIRFAPEKAVVDKKIVLEDGVWVGANTTMLTNAYICEGAVVSSGAIVNHYIPPYCIAYGIPAKKYKRRFTTEDLQEVLTNVGSKYTVDQILGIYKEYGIDS
ncbi:acyltransferase [Aquimarina spongiae]|uniref:Transferase hexapeptide (Six repeat-containing protein) n=1 Tax=Aquimarina spongiae TaxID=570521 RepID=A0A1M6FA77_9FLAO|nr:acyltransferase [Aquimarina spongiae]SHI94556.1 transferase hexapeptide (six repeat-containing protein) [Aquimarina spongiae]